MQDRLSISGGTTNHDPIMTAASSVIDALHAGGPAPDRAEQMNLYGWLIGRWEMDAVVHTEAGTHRDPGEIHFGWVLEGRAIEAYCGS